MRIQLLLFFMLCSTMQMTKPEAITIADRAYVGKKAVLLLLGAATLDILLRHAIECCDGKIKEIEDEIEDEKSNDKIQEQYRNASWANRRLVKLGKDLLEVPRILTVGGMILASIGIFATILPD